MEALSETENDAIAFIHASDAESWAVFLQKKLCSDDYKIESCFHAPDHDDIPELFSSSKTCAVLVSPTLLEEDHSSFWSRCVDLFHQRTVILFLGVSKEDMRGSLGEDITQKVLDQRCLEVDGSLDAVTRALIALIEAYEANDAYEAEGYDYLPPPRERNGILRAFPAVLYEYGSHDILVLLEREEEDTVTMTTEIGCGSPLPIKVERVTFSAYIATLPNKLLGEVELEVLAGNRSLGFFSVRVESRMEQLHSLLLLETSPLTLMCKAMGVWAAGCSDVEELDSMLAQRLTVSQFPSGLLDVMRSDDQATADRDKRRWPTLLHLAAEFNLARVCEELLRYPGMVHDACTENREGLLPCQVAGKKGFHALQRRLIRYVKDMTPGLRRSATDSGISFEESSSPPQPLRHCRSSGYYENCPGPMPGDRSTSVRDDYIDMSGSGLHGGSLKSRSFPESSLVGILPDVGSAEAGGSKETDQSRQHTAELLRQTVSECVSRPNTFSWQHWPDPGRPDTSDDQDHHVPARVVYLATHKQQDPGSSGKTRSWSVSTSRSSTTHSLESRPVSEEWWRLGSRIKGRSASQTSSDSQRSDHEGIAEQEGAEGDAKTAATSQNEASLTTKGPRKSMAKNLISSILKKMNMQRLSHARSESDLHVMANAQKKPVVYSRTNTMSAPTNPSGFRDLSSSMNLNESSMCNDSERDSGTLCDGDYNLSRRRMSLRVERALHEDLSQRPPLPPRKK